MDSPLTLTALAQARALRDRELSAVELTRAYLARIEQHNEDLGAFVSVFPRRALAEARRHDRALAKRDDPTLPTFHGVPCGIKDLDPVRGSLTRLGSPAFRYLWSPVDGPVARAVRRSGAVILGKLATSELALMPVTETDLHPPCRNPWDTTRSSGGSSGGSAGAGSIRIPATFCGLFGFKPSREHGPAFYGRMEPMRLSTIGSVSRDVADTAAMLDALAGLTYDPRRPPEGSLLASMAREVPRLRVRVCDRSTLCDAEPAARQAVADAARLLEELGHTVEPGDRLEETLDRFIPIYACMASRLPVLRPSLLQPPTRWLRQQARGRTLEAALARREEMATSIRTWFGDADVWLTPAVPEPPPPVGAWAHMDGESAFRRAARLGAFTACYNIGGHPAASVPFDLTGDERLPVAIQLAARPGQDALLLGLCREVEAARPWRHRWPAAFAP